MPRRRLPSRQEDPFRRIKNWDDGYKHLSQPYYSTPPLAPAPPREAWEWGLDQDPRQRRGGRSAGDRYPSPPPYSDEYSRPNTPPYRRAAPPGDGDTGHRGPGLKGRDRAPSTPRARTRARTPSPSPPRRQERDRDRTRDPYPRSRYRSPSPSPPPPPPRRTTTTTTSRGRDRAHDRPRPRARSRPPSPPPALAQPKAKAKAKAKTKTKTKTGFPSLSPRWQKAAAAALQAGGLAALNLRSQPGDWKGEKGARVATAALGAAMGDVFGSGRNSKRGDGGARDKSRDRDRDRGSGRGGGRRRDVEILGDALGGFIAERLARRRR